MPVQKSTCKSHDVTRMMEYEKNNFNKHMVANADTDEAQVWKSLKGKSASMQQLQREFMMDFKTKGFGFIQGTKWMKHISKEIYSVDDEYKTYEQILDAEKSESNAKAKIAYALTLGEGVPSNGKGWFKDPSRNDAPVYFYVGNMKHSTSIAKLDCMQTDMLTDVHKLQDVEKHMALHNPLMAQLSGPAPGSAISTSTPTTPQISTGAHSAGSATSTSAPITPQTSTGAHNASSCPGTPSSQASTLPLDPNQETPKLRKPIVGSSMESGDAALDVEMTDAMTAAQIIAKAMAMVDKLKHEPILTSVMMELVRIHTLVHGIPQPKSNHHAVKELKEFTEKCVAIYNVVHPP